MPNPGYNPNAPAALGLEYLLARAFSQRVQPGQTPYWQGFRATATEAVTALRMRQQQTSPASAAPLLTIVDIYEAGDEWPWVDANVTLSPNADQAAGAWTKSGGLGASNLWQHVDDNPVQYPPVSTDYIYIPTSFSGPSNVNFRLNAAPIPVGARIVQVVVAAVIGSVASPTPAFRQWNFRLEHLPSGDRYTAVASGPIYSDIYGDLVLFSFGEVNPRTLLPWTPGDIASFDSGGDWALRVESVGGAGTLPALHSLGMSVHYLPTENRVAAGVWRRVPSAPTWVTTDALVSLPSGAAGWSKVAGTDYRVVWRPAHAPQHVGNAAQAADLYWSVVQARAGGGMPHQDADAIPVSREGLPVREYFGGLARGAGLAFMVGAAVSNDSQVYGFELASIRFLSSGTPNGVGQRMTPASTASYLGVRGLIAVPAAATGSVTFRVVRVSDGVQMGGTLVMSAADLRDLPPEPDTSDPPLRYFEGQLSSAASLVAGTQYELRATVTGSGTWQVRAGRVGGDAALAGASFGGSTNGFREGATTYTDQDAPWVLMLQPAALTNVRVSVVDAPTDGHGALCSVDRIEQVVVEWSPSAIGGGGFARYEIERLEDDGTDTWHPVHHITSESVDSWTDREARRNRASAYRVRVVATSAAFSPWAETDWAHPQSIDAEVVITSNADPSVEMVFDRQEREGITPLDAASDQVLRLHGRDYQVVFKARERRGNAIDYVLTVNVGAMPTDVHGREVGSEVVFAPLVDATRRSDLPYLCVLDHYGNRWFAHLELGDGDHTEPGWQYDMPVTVVPLQGLPAVTVD